MRIPTVGWAFFGLTVFVLLVYALSLGVFVGTEVRWIDSSTGGFYSGDCKYLYLSGLRKVWGGSTGKTPVNVAEETFCPVFAKQ
jgi:hypothetical protein